MIDVTVAPEEYVRLISSISDQFALAILMVDLTDFPCSIWPEIHTIIGTKRPVFVVGNKIDLLPRDSPSHLRHVRECLDTAVELSGKLIGNEMNWVHLNLDTFSFKFSRITYLEDILCKGKCTK